MRCSALQQGLHNQRRSAAGKSETAANEEAISVNKSYQGNITKLLR